jgi:hypothetical protein
MRLRNQRQATWRMASWRWRKWQLRVHSCARRWYNICHKIITKTNKVWSGLAWAANASCSSSLIPHGKSSLDLRVFNSGDVLQRLLCRLNREAAVAVDAVDAVDCELDTVGASGLSTLPANNVRSLSQLFAERESSQGYILYLERNIQDVAASPPGVGKYSVDYKKNMAELIVIIKCYIILQTYISIQQSTLYDPYLTSIRNHIL